MKRSTKLCWLLCFFALVTMTETSMSRCFGQTPAAPSDLTVQLSAPGDLAISLFWIDNSSNETGFEIQRAVGDTNDFQVIHLGSLNNLQSYNDVGLEEVTTYSYRVRSYNEQGFSDFSNITTATTGYARPQQVSNLQGFAVGGAAALSWVDESDNETRFEVQRAELGVSTSFETIATLEPNSTAEMSYLDLTTLGGIVYVYRVVPWRFDVEGGAPLTVDIQTGDAIPGPSRFSARPRSRSAIQLSWRGFFGRAETMQIQRFNFTTGFWQTIAQPRATNRTYVDSGLESQTFYMYRIRRTTDRAVSWWLEASSTTR